jgi:protein LTV1
LNDGQRAHVGEAALYGVYYDDTEYDYMQHLRNVGEQEEGVESILIEAPSASQKSSSKARDKQPISLRDLPPESFPSASELPRNYESQEAVPSSIAGFQPDMDPHLRQVLEALDDEAFVDDELEDDFFGQLVEDGERGPEEQVEFEFYEGDGLDGRVVQEKDRGEVDGEVEGGWEVRFAKFKNQQIADSSSDLDANSEGEDTIGRLPELSVIGGKRRRKGTSDASGYSMSSSSLFRNDALQTLDERFDHARSFTLPAKNVRH